MDWYNEMRMEKVTLPDGEVVRKYMKDGREAYILSSGKHVYKELHERGKIITKALVKNLNEQME